MKKVLVLPALVLSAVSFGLTSCASLVNDSEHAVTGVAKGGATVVTTTGTVAAGAVRDVGKGGVVLVKGVAKGTEAVANGGVAVVKGASKGTAKVLHGAEVQ